MGPGKAGKGRREGGGVGTRKGPDERQDLGGKNMADVSPSQGRRQCAHPLPRVREAPGDAAQRSWVKRSVRDRSGSKSLEREKGEQRGTGRGREGRAPQTETWHSTHQERIADRAGGGGGEADGTGKPGGPAPREKPQGPAVPCSARRSRCQPSSPGHFRGWGPGRELGSFRAKATKAT